MWSQVKIGFEPKTIERNGFVVQRLADCATRSLVYGIYDTSLHDTMRLLVHIQILVA
jgi:hypothetical protein